MDIDDVWAAGILEGEGCFDIRRRQGNHPYLRIRVKMVDEDIIERIAEIWGSTYWERTNGKWQNQFETEIGGSGAVAFCRRVMPLWGKRRTETITRIIDEIEAAKHLPPA